MAIDASLIQSALEDNFPGATIKIDDLAGDNDHYSLEITSDKFNGKTLIEQHKMVNEALKFCLGTSLHALKIKTKSE
jgi:stress-induced morphogen